MCHFLSSAVMYGILGSPFGALRHLESVPMQDLYHDIRLGAEHIVAAILMLMGAKIVIRLGTKTIMNIMTHRHMRLDERRGKTISTLLGNILRYVVYFFLILTILDLFGIPVTTILTGAGIAGVALGFGAQSLVKDVISGFFILFEDQFGVGDEIMTGSYRGVVQEVGLRLTKIRSWTGELHLLPNGTIGQVTNFSKSNSLAVLDINVAYEEDLDHVLAVLNRVLLEARRENPDMVGDPVVQGVQHFGPSDMTVRCVAECAPTKQYSVMRDLRKRIKDAFDREGIAFPYPRQVTIPYESHKSKAAPEEV